MVLNLFYLLSVGMFLKLEKLVKILTTMNGVGSRSARKIALELIKDKHNLMFVFLRMVMVYVILL